MAPALGSINGSALYMVSRSPAWHLHEHFLELTLPAGSHTQQGCFADSEVCQPRSETSDLVVAHTVPDTAQVLGATQVQICTPAYKQVAASALWLVDIQVH